MTAARLISFVVFNAVLVYGISGLCDYMLLSEMASWTKFLSFMFGPLWAMVVLMITKIAELADLPGLEVEQQRRLESIVRPRQVQLWIYGWMNLFAGFLAVFASLVGTAFPWGKWVVMGSLLSVGWSLYFAWFIPGVFEEIRRFRWRVREEEKLSKARDTVLRDLSTSAPDVGVLTRSRISS